MATTVNNRANAYYQKANHIRLPQTAICKATITLDDGSTPETLFNDAVPANMGADAAPYTLGLGFRVLTAGEISAIKFYQTPDDPTTARSVSLYTLDSFTPIAVTYDYAVSGSGWKTIPLPAPVAVTPGVLYVAGVYVPLGYYAYTSQLFLTDDYISGNLVAPDTTEANGNGRFRNDIEFGRPDQSFNATWYGIDIVFEAD